MLGSAAVHIVLLAALGVGSAFVSSSVLQDSDELAPLPTIQQIPSNLVDELIYNPGGAQEIGPTQEPASIPAPAPAPAAAPAPKPTPAPEKPVTPPKVETKPAAKPTPAPAPAAAQRERQAWADALSNVKGTIQEGSGRSSSSSGESGLASQAKITGASLGTGDGTGSGEAVANYAQAVCSYYRNAWISPSTLKDDKLTAVARIIINRNGSIQSATITSRSGDKELDASVQRAIDSVVKLPPFPKNSTDSTRTYTIRFNLRGATI